MAQPDDASDEGVRHLRRLLRFDTTNPPGNERPAADYLATVLAAEGIQADLVEPAAGRAVLHARIRGNGSARPILLTAHMDVVDVDRSRWSTDPFGAEIRDGFVYGRGAIDDKGMLAANLMAFLRVHRELASRKALDRDLIFLATSDEESGGRFGMSWIIGHHPEFVDAEYAINEGGRIRMVDGRPRYAAIQTAEKIPYVVSLVATGPGGHASIPLDGMAIARLARALSVITSSRLPLTLSPTTRAFFSRLGEIWTDPEVAAAMTNLVAADPRLVAEAETVLSREPRFDAVLRDTIVPSVVSAGTRHNVIPASAEATLSMRLLPGHRPEDVLAELSRRIADPSVSLEVRSRGTDAPASDFESPMFRAMESALASLDPRIVAVPYLSTGATESAYLRSHGIQCFGMLPFPLSDDDESRMHGDDERLSLEAFRFGQDFLFETVRALLGTG